MSDLGWRADGIERALAAGGVELEVYRRPGFRSELGVRRVSSGGGATGFAVELPWEDEPGLDDRARRRVRRRR